MILTSLSKQKTLSIHDNSVGTRQFDVGGRECAHSGFCCWGYCQIGIRLCEPQPRRRRDIRVVPVLLGVFRRVLLGNADLINEIFE